MTRPTPAQYDLARRLLAREAAGREDPAGLVAAAEAVCEKLRARVALVLGAAGFHALFFRALQMASNESPFLADVQAEIASACSFERLRERAAGHDSRQMADGLAAVIASFIWLLAAFVGEGLTRVFLGQAFPEVIHGGGVSGSEAANTGEDKQ